VTTFERLNILNNDMPTILLIRHAENDYVKKGLMAGRLPNIHLNEKGRLQVQALTERLSKAPIKAVYTSPLERAIETAEPLAKALGLEAIICPALAETDIGEWENQSHKKLRRLKAWKIVQGAPSLFRFPGGESFAECQGRIVAEIETLRTQHDEKDLIACVSHADPIKLAVAYYLGLPLDHFQRLSASPASITALHISEMGSRLLSLNFDPSFNLSKP
jgi:probable phosphoglycerate mutase